MLKELLSPTLECIQVDGQFVLVRSRRAMKVGRVASLRVAYPDRRRSSVFTMMTDSCRPLESGGFAVSGRIVSGTVVPEGQAPFTDSALRAHPRLDCHICVLSKDLPGYRAVTVDFSVGGLQLELSEKVAVGQDVLLRLEFDVASIAPVDCRARVAWCQPKDRSRYRLGLQFHHLDGRVRQSLEQYERILTGREDTCILHRLVFGNDYGLQEGVSSSQPELTPPQKTPLQPLTGSQHEGRLIGYSRGGHELTVRVQGPDGRVRDYKFCGIRGLADHAGGDPTQIAIGDLVVRAAAGGAKRFQFIDSYRSVLLEVVASDYVLA